MCDEALVQVRVVWNLAHSLVTAWGFGRDMVKDLGRMEEEFPGASLGLIGSTTIVPVGSGELGDVTCGDSLVGRSVHMGPETPGLRLRTEVQHLGKSSLASAASFAS